MVAAEFSGLFDTGGIRPDGLVLQPSGATRREAMIRVTTLTGMEQAMACLPCQLATIMSRGCLKHLSHSSESAAAAEAAALQRRFWDVHELLFHR